MTKSVRCSYCNTPNQEGDKFCLECGKPLGGASTLVLSNSILEDELVGQANPGPKRTGTIPLSKTNSFLSRPTKAIFGDRFLVNNLVHEDDRQHGYLVTEVTKEEKDRIKQCTNPECGAVHLPMDGVSENFCTSCSSPLSSAHLVLTLFEARSPIFGYAAKIPELGLVHAGIRAPVAAFHEKVGGEDRFCLVNPYTESLNHNFERNQVLHWGEALTSAFAYLHENGVTFKGQFVEDILSLTNGNAVIASFFHCHVAESVSDAARTADFHTLAGILFKWLTGRTQYGQDPALTPALNAFFGTALTSPGFATAEEFAQAFENACHPVTLSTRVEFKLGRLTDVGVARSLNEDSLLTIQFDKYLESLPHLVGVYVVADGMGGHSAGEVASGAIVSTIAAKVFSDQGLFQGTMSPEDRCSWIESAIDAANKAVYEMGKKLGSDMGSTIVMAVAEGNTVCLGHVGDSRAYLINSHGISALTKDHSLVERLVDSGQITREEARFHPQRNVIYRTMGDKAKIEVETTSYTMKPGDRLLLCSDGLNGMVADAGIFKIVMEEALSPQDACEKLVRAANAAGGDDNITVVVVEFT